MSNVEIMTELEHQKAHLLGLQYGITGNEVYGLSSDIGTFKIGSGCKDAERLINVLSHESIHDILKVIFTNVNMSMRLDRDLYYNFEVVKKSQGFNGLTVRDSTLELFTIDEQTYI